MLRLFNTHEIRRQTILSERIWQFTPVEGENAGKHYPVSVPSCWETYPGFENYRGKALYETSFEAGGNIRLEFKGVSHMAEVYIDDNKVTSHYNAYTPFSAIIRSLEPGLHHLKVVVDNSFKAEYALNRPNDYMSYGGISRGVSMENIGDVFISKVHLTPVWEDGSWKGRVKIICTNIGDDTKEMIIKFHLHKTQYAAKCVTVPDSSVCVMDEILDFGQPEAWSPENPKLYRMRAVLLTDTGEACDDFIDRIGFRTVNIEGDRIVLNGKPLRIKGFCRHEDHPQYGNALPLQAMAYDLNLIKDMGGNSVRTSHYPNDELFLDLCDELGILVWEENHVRGGDEKRMRNPYFELQAEQVIREMIMEHYNHPSIYIWGIMNECASDTEFGRNCYKSQYKLIRELDQSRPCSSASCKFGRHGSEICTDLPDVISWNMYPYWYEEETAAELVDKLYRWTAEEGAGKGKPFLVTEIGAGAVYGFRSAEHDPWTEEYQAEVIGRQLREVMNYKPCMGLYIWQFCDNRVSREWFERRPRTRNNKGIVDEFRRRKLSYDVVKNIFRSYTNYWDS